MLTNQIIDCFRIGSCLISSYLVGYLCAADSDCHSVIVILWLVVQYVVVSVVIITYFIIIVIYI